LQLATIDPATGQLAKIKSTSFGASIAENAWHSLVMNVLVSGDVLIVRATAFRHVTPQDPTPPCAN